jgi:hypothetical protein
MMIFEREGDALVEEEISFDESTMLELRPESVKEKQDAYTSLTDLYGVEVFTNWFEEKVSQEASADAVKDTEITSSVFSGRYDMTDTGKDEIYGLLFTENTSQVLMQDYKNTGREISAFSIFMVGISMLGVLLLYRIFWIEKKGGRRKNAYKLNAGYSE